VCDVAYAIQVEQIEAQARTEQLGALLAMGAGARQVRMPPGPLDKVAEFDEWLTAHPQRTDTHEYRLLRVLGLRQ
jgi:hypothetical protein